MDFATRVEPGQRIKLAKIDPNFTAGLSKAQAATRLEELGAELGQLQQLLYAASTHSLLIVLQAMDTGGKDGTIRHVIGYFDPTGCRVESFKAPTAEELSHDFLWRVHRVTPLRGLVTVFNRSHYEDVLIARVKKLVPPALWKQRYDHINHFEDVLVDNNTLIVKFFLHISQDEQEKRLLAREKQAEKAWKMAVADWEERRFWDDYQTAYEDALRRCSTPAAPWHIVPANKKWYRNVAVAAVLVEALRPYKNTWKAFLNAESKRRLKELQSYRAQK